MRYLHHWQEPHATKRREPPASKRAIRIMNNPQQKDTDS